MKLRVKDIRDNSIYYVTPKMLKDSNGSFVLVDENKKEKVLSAISDAESRVEDVDVDLNDIDPVEELREELRARDIPFHPSCGEKTLRKKLEEAS